MTGNKSSTLLLTIFGLTPVAATNGLPLGLQRAPSKMAMAGLAKTPEGYRVHSHSGVIVARTRLGAVWVV
jgi:hypothetical protein